MRWVQGGRAGRARACEGVPGQAGACVLVRGHAWARWGAPRRTGRAWAGLGQAEACGGRLRHAGARGGFAATFARRAASVLQGRGRGSRPYYGFGGGALKHAGACGHAAGARVGALRRAGACVGMRGRARGGACGACGGRAWACVHAPEARGGFARAAPRGQTILWFVCAAARRDFAGPRAGANHTMVCVRGGAPRVSQGPRHGDRPYYGLFGRRHVAARRRVASVVFKTCCGDAPNSII